MIVVRFLGRWWPLLAILVLWQTAVWVFGITPFLLPGPVSILQGLIAQPGTFLVPLLETLRTAAIGFVLGVAIGYLAAALTWLWPILGTALTPLALALRAVPFVALIPVLTKIFGYSDTTAYVICTIVCFFPTFVLVGSGFSDLPANGADLFQVNGASRWARFRLLAVPSSLPALATSARISAAAAFAAALISEFLMGTQGLALVLANALDRLSMVELWGAAVCAAVVSIAAYLAATGLERLTIQRWR